MCPSIPDHLDILLKIPSLGICWPCGFHRRTVRVMLHVVADPAISILIREFLLLGYWCLGHPACLGYVATSRLFLYRLSIDAGFFLRFSFVSFPKPNSLAFWLVHIARARFIIFSKACDLNELKTNYRVCGQTRESYSLQSFYNIINFFISTGLFLGIKLFIVNPIYHRFPKVTFLFPITHWQVW